MKDSEKLLILLYDEIQSGNDLFEIINSNLIVKGWYCLLEELVNRGLLNVRIQENKVGIGRPLITPKGEQLVVKLKNPWYKKFKFQFVPVFQGVTLLGILSLLLTFVINLDKIECNYHNYIGNGK
ncbi:MAG: hypothetical protein PHE78_08105, partial [Candidatus Gastranaerophilales bacterium]|nr:hypothetical protein [Candidatus Gastranaerophilales bacterium]